MQTMRSCDEHWGGVGWGAGRPHYQRNLPPDEVGSLHKVETSQRAAMSEHTSTWGDSSCWSLLTPCGWKITDFHAVWCKRRFVGSNMRMNRGGRGQTPARCQAHRAAAAPEGSPPGEQLTSAPPSGTNSSF